MLGCEREQGLNQTTVREKRVNDLAGQVDLRTSALLAWELWYDDV